MDEAFNRYQAQPKKNVGKQPSGAKLAIQRLKPQSDLRLEAELTKIIDAIKQAEPEGAIPVRCRTEFRLWLDTTRQIANDAKRVEADGCYYLSSTYRPWDSSATTGDAAAAAILMSKIGGVHLQTIKTAAESLLDWAFHNPPTNRGSNGATDDLAKPQQQFAMAQEWRIPGTAVICRISLTCRRTMADWLLVACRHSRHNLTMRR